MLYGLFVQTTGCGHLCLLSRVHTAPCLVYSNIYSRLRGAEKAGRRCSSHRTMHMVYCAPVPGGRCGPSHGALLQGQHSSWVQPSTMHTDSLSFLPVFMSSFSPFPPLTHTYMLPLINSAESPIPLTLFCRKIFVPLVSLPGLPNIPATK